MKRGLTKLKLVVVVLWVAQCYSTLEIKEHVGDTGAAGPSVEANRFGVRLECRVRGTRLRLFFFMASLICSSTRVQQRGDVNILVVDFGATKQDDPIGVFVRYLRGSLTRGGSELGCGLKGDGIRVEQRRRWSGPTDLVDLVDQ